MKHVHQFQLNMKDQPQLCEMGNGTPLSFDAIDNNAWLSALVEDGAQLTPRWFIVVPTGKAVPDGAVYIGSTDHVQMQWHLFETFEHPETIHDAVPLPVTTFDEAISEGRAL